MKKTKFVIFMLLLIITIGFAAVNYTLSIDGNADLAGDIDNFKVYFSNVKVNGIVDYSIVTSTTSLNFSNVISEPGETYEITYDVTNASKHFDASLTMTCTSGNEYLSVVNNFDTSTNLVALETRSGTLTLKKLKSIASYDITSNPISCTLTATPVERNSVLSGEVTPSVKVPTVLRSFSDSDRTTFRDSKYIENIKTISFADEINIPDDAIESWDLGENETGYIMGYIIENEEDSSYYDLHIQSYSEIKANEDMSFWFANMTNLESINNIELLNTSNTTNMGHMFSSTATNSNLNLDLSSFDTSKVTNMGGMFSQTGQGNNFTLDVSSFDTSNVTDMGSMFTGTGMNDKDFTLDVSNFDTSNVTNMDSMFSWTGMSSTVFTLDISNFKTNKVTNMMYMFAGIGYSNPNFELDISNFDTSNVTLMDHMFESVGYNSTTLKLNLSKMNTSKATTMNAMFYDTGYNSTDFTLDVSSFDTSNVTSMNAMFNNAGHSATNFTLDTSKFDISKTTDTSEMFFNTGYNSNVFNTSISITNPELTIETSAGMFWQTAMQTGSQITVNYTSKTESLVDYLISSNKSSGSNIVKGEKLDLISFSIESYFELEADEGMTWAEFIESDYNTANVYLVDETTISIRGNENCYMVDPIDFEKVSPEDEIIADADYYLSDNQNEV